MTLNLGNLSDLQSDDPDERAAMEQFYAPERLREYAETSADLARRAKMPQFRRLLNREALLQYRCRPKGCLLAALVDINGTRYWLRQTYVTGNVPIALPRGLAGVEALDDVAVSVPEFVALEPEQFLGPDSRKKVPRELARMSDAWRATAVPPDGKIGWGSAVEDWWQASCRHSSLNLVDTTLDEQVSLARRAKDQTIRV